MNTPGVCIIDYGGGNIQSVLNVFKGMNMPAHISHVEQDINEATHLVLPGVGAFNKVMKGLKDFNLIDIIKENVFGKKKPFLGICIGMQILGDEGYENEKCEGLGFIPGVVKKMDVGDLALPHMGWNNLQIKNQSLLMQGVSSEVDFYFVHSYCFIPADNRSVAATFDYAGEHCAVIQRENIFGVQFHPEKSQKAGKIIFENFLNIG